MDKSIGADRKPGVIATFFCTLGLMVAMTIALMIIRLVFSVLDFLQGEFLLDMIIRHIIAAPMAGYFTMQAWQDYFPRFDGGAILKWLVAISVLVVLSYLAMVLPVADRIGVTPARMIAVIAEIVLVVIGARFAVR